MVLSILMHKSNIWVKWFVALDTWPQRRSLTWTGKDRRLMFDLRILKCVHIPSVRRIILIYIKPRCLWYVWTIPPLSGATERPWITPQGCQPKKRKEGLWAVDITSQKCLLSGVRSRQGGGWEYTSKVHTSYIGWQFTFFVFCGTTPASLWFVCPCYYLSCCEHVWI